jgi:hypothetical protein
MVVSVPAASAHGPDSCTFTGTASTQNLVYYPAPDKPSATGGVVASLIGVCAAGLHSVSAASGHFTAGIVPGGNYCGQSEGVATLDGHTGNWVSHSTYLTFYGPGLYGTVQAVPDALAGESCVSGADRFIVSGSLELV